MTDSPSTGLFTRYVLENPYPLSIGLGIAMLVLIVVGLREGRKPPLLAGAGCAIAGVLVFLISTLVTTAGEHGEAVTREFVERVVEGDTNGAVALLSPDVSLTIRSPNNPGQGLDFFQRRLVSLHGQYTITDNRITTLRGYSHDADTAIVQLSCRTDVTAGYGPTPSSWQLRVERQPNDQWLITQITALSIAGREPPDRLW
jgi:hypothetical protein